MIIEIISTGDEVLTGFTVDTNSAWLCQRLLDHGWQVRRRQTVGDRMDDLVDILRERGRVADILIVNEQFVQEGQPAFRAGGLGVVLHR